MEALKKISQNISDIEKIVVDALDLHGSSYPTTPNALLKFYVFREIGHIPKEDIPDMLKILNELIPKITSSSSTLEKTMTYIRNLIKNQFGANSEEYKVSKSLMKFKGKKEKIKAQKEKLLKANQDKIQISRDTLEKVIAKLKPDKWLNDTIIYVLLATGSRLIEVLKISEYKAMPNGVIEITGMAKSKDEKTIQKPILFSTPDTIVKLVSYIRETIKDDLDKSNENLTNKYNAIINRDIKELFNKNITSHTLRKIYANQSYEIFADKNKITRNAWLNQVLGHSPFSLETSLHYNNLAILETIPEEKEEVKQNITPVIKFDVNDLSDVIVEIDGKRFFKLQHKREAEPNKLQKFKTVMETFKKEHIPLINANFKKIGIGARTLSLIPSHDR